MFFVQIIFSYGIWSNQLDTANILEGREMIKAKMGIVQLNKMIVCSSIIIERKPYRIQFIYPFNNGRGLPDIRENTVQYSTQSITFQICSKSYTPE